MKLSGLSQRSRSVNLERSLTMRTFHLGGIASAGVSPEIVADHEGILVYTDLRTVKNEEGQWIALNKNGTLEYCPR